jgi:hypothetical protein
VLEKNIIIVLDVGVTPFDKIAVVEKVAEPSPGVTVVV